jgi:iron complex outermembrane receptor protein
LSADWKTTYVVNAEEKTTNEAGVPAIPSNGIATNGGIGFRALQRRWAGSMATSA